jgi:hypothetical protein
MTARNGGPDGTQPLGLEAHAIARLVPWERVASVDTRRFEDVAAPNRAAPDHVAGAQRGAADA